MTFNDLIILLSKYLEILKFYQTNMFFTLNRCTSLARILELMAHWCGRWYTGISHPTESSVQMRILGCFIKPSQGAICDLRSSS